MNKVTYIGDQITVFKSGQFWKHEDGTIYILAQTPGSYLLIPLDEGKCWANNKKKIEDVFDGDLDKFTLIQGEIKIQTNEQS